MLRQEEEKAMLRLEVLRMRGTWTSQRTERKLATGQPTARGKVACAEAGRSRQESWLWNSS